MGLLFEEIAVLIILGIIGVWIIGKLWERYGNKFEKHTVNDIEKEIDDFQTRISKEQEEIVSNGLKLLKTKKKAGEVLEEMAKKMKE